MSDNADDQEKPEPDQGDKPRYVPSGTAWLPIGIAVGVALGVVLDNIGLGIALGVAVGAALMAAKNRSADTK